MSQETSRLTTYLAPPGNPKVLQTLAIGKHLHSKTPSAELCRLAQLRVEIGASFAAFDASLKKAEEELHRFGAEARECL